MMTTEGTFTITEEIGAFVDTLRLAATGVAGQDKARPVLCSVRIRGIDGGVRIEATDSFVLIRRDFVIDAKATDELDVLLDAATLKKALSATACKAMKRRPVLELDVSDHSCIVGDMIVPTVEGTFPNAETFFHAELMSRKPADGGGFVSFGEPAMRLINAMVKIHDTSVVMIPDPDREKCDLKPTKVIARGVPELLALAMPVRLPR